MLVLYGDLAIPFSVIIPVIYFEGVISKAGFAICTLFGVIFTSPIIETSSEFRSSIGISSPLAVWMSIVDIGPTL
jgi:hypothetical protein